MKPQLFKYILALVISGIIASYAVINAVFILSWICYIPVFFLLKKKLTNFFTSGIAFGSGIALLTFSWMIIGAKEFSGNTLMYGILIFILSLVVYSFYTGILFSLIGSCLKRLNNTMGIKAAVVAACFVIFESLWSICFSQMPYYLLNSAYGLLNNIYTIQWASYFGLPVLSFMVIFVNYLIVEIICNHKISKLAWPAGTILIIILGGFLIKLKVEKDVILLQPIKVAIAAENVPPLLKWDNQGNVLAQRILSINKQAALLKPDIVLWSESVIPWTYRTDDDLLLEILKESYPSNTTHVIGMMTRHSKGKVYNSAYGISTNGKVIGRHDKKLPLHFIETPLFGFILPFLNLNSYIIEAGKKSKPIETPFGNAGVSICNEIVIPQASISMVANNSEFLLCLSNDAWFRDNYIISAHFLYAKLSAVINRKDIVINSNNGLSGYIKYTGEVILKRKSNDLFVEVATIYPNRFNNSKYYYPNIIEILSCMLVFYIFLKRFFI